MNLFCQDRDLLALEPVIFLEAAMASQRLVAGVNGVLVGTTFTATSSDFVAWGVEAGMVITFYSATPAEGYSFEIVSVDSATKLTLSALRADVAAAAVAPQSVGGSFFVRTYRPQIQTVSQTLAEKLRQIVEASGIDRADFADSGQLRHTVAHGVLAAVYATRAQNTPDKDANWTKAEHYRDEFARLQLQLRLSVDADGDGLAEQTRTLGNVTLRRV